MTMDEEWVWCTNNNPEKQSTTEEDLFHRFELFH